MAPSGPAQAQTQGSDRIHLRIVGGLARVNQYTRHELPFWSRRLGELTNGRVTAEIVPFDEAGIRGHEMLRLIQLGVVPFGTALLPLSASEEPELAAPDLPGFNPDMATLRRTFGAFRPYVENMLRERYGIEVLAAYTYPAQVVFCAKPFAGLGDLRGRRIRTANASQSHFVEVLGGTPVLTPFAEIMKNFQNGAVDCALTGTMSGNTIGLHEATTHIHGMAVNWGVSFFGANSSAWEILPDDIKSLLRKELRGLEQAIWEESDRETEEGIQCNIGHASCVSGKKGRMTRVNVTGLDEAILKKALVDQILPRWVRSCGSDCADNWNRTIGPEVGIFAERK